MSWDVETASDEWLINLCKREREKAIPGKFSTVQVWKLSDTMAVKVGFPVYQAEAVTQEFANKHVDPKIVRIPRVHRYVVDDSDPTWPVGHIFMESISGTNLKDVDLSSRIDIVPRVARIVEHLGKIFDGQRPGPVGPPSMLNGYLWGDEGTNKIFDSVADMNSWINRRLVTHKKNIDLNPYPLVLCHVDLCRRNMILDDEDHICLVDWGFAGLFPRFFEVTSLSCLLPYDEPYEEPLLSAIEELLNITEEEREMMELMQISRSLSLRYLFEGHTDDEDGTDGTQPDGESVENSVEPL